MAQAQLEVAARLRKAFDTFDVDKNGSLSACELRAVLTRLGTGAALSEDDAAKLLAEFDTDGNGMLSLDEFVVAMSGLEPEQFGSSMFRDLCAQGGGCTIPDTARRAMSLEQLEKIYKHIERRLTADDEVWSVQRLAPGIGLAATDLRDPTLANLYDVDSYVIRPSTKARRCSMVERMATAEQPPDYFVSHWWGEHVLGFTKCLREHSRDRHPPVFDWGPDLYYSAGDEPRTLPSALGRSTRYWVCAYANNQHNLAGEISEDLSQTSFYRAMRLARGTVSVIDAGGVAFSRIWCVYELFSSLPGVRAEGEKTAANEEPPASVGLWKRVFIQTDDWRLPSNAAERVGSSSYHFESPSNSWIDWSKGGPTCADGTVLARLTFGRVAFDSAARTLTSEIELPHGGVDGERTWRYVMTFSVTWERIVSGAVYVNGGDEPVATFGRTDEGMKYVALPQGGSTKAPPKATRYTYDMYTAAPGIEYGRWRHNKEVSRHRAEAVGILDGLSEADAGSGGGGKGRREAHFPQSVLDRALSFACADGEASVAADRTRILAAVDGGGGRMRVDETVHGVVAASSLSRGLLAGGETRALYLAALRTGRLTKLTLDLTAVADGLDTPRRLEHATLATVATVAEVLEALDPSTLEELRIGCADMQEPPARLAAFTKLRMLDLSFNPVLRALPATLGACADLRWLNVTATDLAMLPDLSACPRLEIGLGGAETELDAFDGLIPRAAGAPRGAWLHMRRHLRRRMVVRPPRARAARGGRVGGRGAGRGRLCA